MNKTLLKAMAIKHIFLISNLYQFCVPYGFDPRLKSVLMPERKFQLCSMLVSKLLRCKFSSLSKCFCWLKTNLSVYFDRQKNNYCDINSILEGSRIQSFQQCMPVFFFKSTFGFPILSGDVERDQWHQIGL